MQQIFFYFLLIVVSTISNSANSAQSSEYTFNNEKESFHYSVLQTGENYTFKFANNPKDPITKIKAGRHALLSIYKDASINKDYTESYIKERARCFVFDSHFYTYSLCLLPNDFNVEKKDRFWGFVTQVPNWKWLVTRFLLPALLAFSLFFYFSGRHKVS